MAHSEDEQSPAEDGIVVFNRTKGSVVCSRAKRADTFKTRLFGLLGRRTMAADTGLHIIPSSGVHTFGMSMDIDIVTLDSGRRVLQVYGNTPPWVVRGLSLATRSVLELAAGHASQCGIECGDQLVFGEDRLQLLSH